MEKYPFLLNKINSISLGHAYYDQAREWGQAWLIRNGM
jgi:hypothetical protein